MQTHPTSRRRQLNKAKFKRFAILIGCLYLAATMVRILIYQEQFKGNQSADLVQLEQQLEQAQQVNEELERKIEFARTNAYIERLARDQLGYVKKGEIKFVAGGEQTTSVVDTAIALPTQPPSGPQQEAAPPDADGAQAEQAPESPG